MLLHSDVIRLVTMGLFLTDNENAVTACCFWRWIPRTSSSSSSGGTVVITDSPLFLFILIIIVVVMIVMNIDVIENYKQERELVRVRSLCWYGCGGPMGGHAMGVVVERKEFGFSPSVFYLLFLLLFFLFLTWQKIESVREVCNFTF